MPESHLHALLTTSAVALLPDATYLRVTGSDRVRWLNGMATNSIQSLAPDQGNYNFFLNAQGRIQGDATIWNRGDSFDLITSCTRRSELLAKLDHFIIMDDVEITPAPDDFHILLLAGPTAPALLEQIGFPRESLETRNPLSSLHLTTFALHPHPPVPLVHAHSPLVPRFEFWGDLATLNQITRRLLEAGAARASAADLEQLRILEGTPLFGTDIRDRDLPQETAQTRALHFAKGCYLGQEIVERIRSRGNVHRTFSGFLLTGEIPPAGTALTSEEKAVGELTSVSRIELPTGIIQLGLGYIRREAIERKKDGSQPIQYPNGAATPIPLPYRP